MVDLEAFDCIKFDVRNTGLTPDRFGYGGLKGMVAHSFGEKFFISRRNLYTESRFLCKEKEFEESEILIEDNESSIEKEEGGAWVVYTPLVNKSDSKPSGFWTVSNPNYEMSFAVEVYGRYTD